MSSQSFAGKKLLVVDDDPTICRLFSVILRSSFPDITVDTAINGADALDACDRDQYHVILMDLRMPVMDGLQAFNKIEDLCKKKKAEMPPVVFCTGFLPPPALAEIQGFGARHAVLHKPVPADQLVKAIRERL